MGTIAEKLAYTSSAIDNIRSATKQKNPAFIEDSPLADVAQAILDIEGGGGEIDPRKPHLIECDLTANGTTTLKTSIVNINCGFTPLYFAIAINYQDNNANPMTVFYDLTKKADSGYYYKVRYYRAGATGTWGMTGAASDAVFEDYLEVTSTGIRIRARATAYAQPARWSAWGSSAPLPSNVLVAYYESDVKVDNTNQSYHKSAFPLQEDDDTILYDSTTKVFTVNKKCNLLIWGTMSQVGGASTNRGVSTLYINDEAVDTIDSYWANEPAKTVYSGSFEVGDTIRIYNNSASWNTIGNLLFYRTTLVYQPMALLIDDSDDSNYIIDSKK